MSQNTEQSVNPTLAVIIPYYDGTQFIEDCVSSVLESSMLPKKLYIIDNDPAGLSMELPLWTYEHVIVIRTRPMIGFGRAVNIGVSEAIGAGYTLFLVLNQDTRIDKFCIASMVLSNRTGLKPTLTSAMIYSYDSKELHPHFIQYILEDQTTYLADRARNNVKPTYPLTRIGAACVLFETDLCQSVGLFDPHFYMYGEDNDLCLRIRKIGGELLLSTSAYVHHFHSLAALKDKHNIKINSWLVISRILLRIRYSNLRVGGFILRAAFYFFKAVFRVSANHTSPLIFLRYTPQILFNWRSIKSISTDHIQKRIERQIKKDRF